MTEKIINIINQIKNFSFLELEEFNSKLALEFNIDLTSNFNSFLIKKEDNNLELNSLLEIEKNTFSIILNEILTDKKISVLKLVRTITGLGLKESKEIVDNLPSLIKENLTKEEAEKLKLEIELAGGISILK